MVGYRIKRNLKAGDIMSDRSSFFEEVYEPLDPVDELAEYAMDYAHFRNDASLSTKIQKLVEEIKGK